MGGEPWCFPPDVIADLTDFQIHNAYALPAVARARREQERTAVNTSTTTQADVSPSPPPGVKFVGPTVRELGSTADEVAQFYRSMGLSEATARRMAADQLKGE